MGGHITWTKLYIPLAEDKWELSLCKFNHTISIGSWALLGTSQHHQLVSRDQNHMTILKHYSCHWNSAMKKVITICVLISGLYLCVNIFELWLEVFQVNSRLFYTISSQDCEGRNGVKQLRLQEENLPNTATKYICSRYSPGNEAHSFCVAFLTILWFF